MRTLTILSSLLLFGCDDPDTLDTLSEAMEIDTDGPIGPTGIVGEITLISTLQNGEAVEMGLRVDPIETTMGTTLDAALAMLDENGEEHPNLQARGRTRFVPVAGNFDSMAAALAALEASPDAPDTVNFDVRTELVPGTAFAIDTFGRQDYLAWVVDSRLDVEGRCTERAMLSLDFEKIVDW